MNELKEYQKRLKVVPKEVANDCPEYCPVCGERLVATFRFWGVNVTATFVHKKRQKDHKKVYRYDENTFIPD